MSIECESTNHQTLTERPIGTKLLVRKFKHLPVRQAYRYIGYALDIGVQPPLGQFPADLRDVQSHISLRGRSSASIILTTVTRLMQAIRLAYSHEDLLGSGWVTGQLRLLAGLKRVPNCQSLLSQGSCKLICFQMIMRLD